MHSRWFAILLLCCGLGATGAFVASSIDAGDAQAAKKKKKRKGRPPRAAGQQQPRGNGASQPLPPIQRTQRLSSCPADMVNVAGHFCVDRWEASVVDADSGRPLSPYYPPHPRLANIMHKHWQANFSKEVSQSRALMLEAGVIPPRGLGSWDADPSRWLADASVSSDRDAGDDDAEPPPLVPTLEAPHGWTLLGDAGDDAQPRPVILLPILPPWQVDTTFRPKAVSRPNVRPQGYVPGFVADPACRAAGKRLCRETEWVFACKGQAQTKHPYGDEYRQGRCNVFRNEHPARVVHGNCSVGLSDPRLNMIAHGGELLLRDTGATTTCRSVWGNDAILDMVGNVDEWVDDPSGVFVGGFYSRNTRNGCEARVGAHPPVYFDYSTGFRCCADLVGGDI